MLPGQRESTKFQLRLFPCCFQTFVLFPSTFQSQLLNIIIGIADLVHHAQCNQKLRRQIAVHMSMQICMELALAADISLYKGLFDTQAIVFRLTHQGFGYGRDGGLELDAPIGKDVCNLRPAQAQNIHTTIVPVKIAGDFSRDHEQTTFILRCLKLKKTGQVPDQIACVVVRRTHNITHALTLHIEIDNNILLPIQIKLLKEYDGSTPPFMMLILPCTSLFFKRQPPELFQGIAISTHH